MAQIGTYVKPAPIGSSVITTDHVIAQGYDFVYLKMGGMLKVREEQVDGDLTVGSGAAYAPPASLTFSTDLPASTTLTVGDPLELTVAPSGGISPYSIEWFKDGAKIANATSATLNLGNATLAMAGKYHATVKDGMGTVHTSTVTTVAAE